jgi:ADP-heptose:LPS heptosyltransferase
MSRHVLYARLDNDGDVLLQGPAIRAVAAQADRVTLLCGPRGQRAAELLPGVDAVHVFRAPWIDPEPEPVTREVTDPLVRLVEKLQPGEAFIATSFHQSALPLALLLRHAGVRVIAAISEDYPGSLLDVRHRDPGDVHEAERGLDLVATLGYALPDGDDGRLEILRAGVRPDGVPDGDYVVVHPGASVPARAWEPEHNRALVQRLADDGRRVVVTGGPAETELTAFVAGPPRPEVTDLGGATDLAGLAEVIAHAGAIVVGNTGPAHLAAAVGTPVVSLFAPTVPAVRWRPWKVPHELLFLDVPCAGCRARVCPIPDHPCLSAVTPEHVHDAVDRLALVTA